MPLARGLRALGEGLPQPRTDPTSSVTDPTVPLLPDQGHLAPGLQAALPENSPGPLQPLPEGLLLLPEALCGFGGKRGKLRGRLRLRKPRGGGAALLMHSQDVLQAGGIVVVFH